MTTNDRLICRCGYFVIPVVHSFDDLIQALKEENKSWALACITTLLARELAYFSVWCGIDIKETESKLEEIRQVIIKEKNFRKALSMTEKTWSDLHFEIYYCAFGKPPGTTGETEHITV